MKTKKLFAALCGAVMVAMSSCCNADNVTLRYSQLPQPVKQFMGKYFVGEKVTKAVYDKDDAVPEYDVYFTNGTKVEIDANGVWTEISNPAGVPTKMLPDAILTYLADNYTTNKVVKIDKDSKGYEVKLDNAVELEFDTMGVFQKIDK